MRPTFMGLTSSRGVTVPGQVINAHAVVPNHFLSTDVAGANALIEPPMAHVWTTCHAKGPAVRTPSERGRPRRATGTRR
jgi:hypothetical protein